MLLFEAEGNVKPAGLEQRMLVAQMHMDILSQAFPPGWPLPLSIGTCIGATIWALRTQLLRRHRGSAHAALGDAQAGRPKRKPKKHMRRGTPGGDKAAAEGESPPEAGDACTREVVNDDAVAWMERLPARGFPPGSSVLTGVPDIHEVDPEGRMGLSGWQQWFQNVIQLMLERLPEGGLAIFMQTDIRADRNDDQRRKSGDGCYWEWVDKAHLVLLAAARVPGARLLWHKIVFSGVVSAGGGRSGSAAGYTHFLCFTTGSDAEPFESYPFPDVSRKGLSTWVSGSGAHSVERACGYLKARGCSLVVDPFCGEGAVLAVANAMGMAALGVEFCKKRARLAGTLDGHELLAADRAEREGSNV